MLGGGVAKIRSTVGSKECSRTLTNSLHRTSTSSTQKPETSTTQSSNVSLTQQSDSQKMGFKGNFDSKSSSQKSSKTLPDFADGAPPPVENLPKGLRVDIIRKKAKFSKGRKMLPGQTLKSLTQRLQHCPKEMPTRARTRSESSNVKEKISLTKKIQAECDDEFPQQRFFPSCIHFTFLRLLAFALLFCAWIIVLAFPCLRFTYHIPVLSRGELHSLATTVPLKDTCRLMPHWWGEQQAFVERIVQTTGYYKAMNASASGRRHFEFFEDEEGLEVLKPYNGQRFVIFGCIILAFPILLLLMFLRCIYEEEDLMEEAMFDLVEISIFSVFTVVEFYMASGTEIRAFMDLLCVRYIERGTRVKGYLKEKVYNICNDVEIEAYGFIASGTIFLFLVFLFAIDLIILLKNAEQVESHKYLRMAACLHYGKPLEQMTNSAREVPFAESSAKRKST